MYIQAYRSTQIYTHLNSTHICHIYVQATRLHPQGHTSVLLLRRCRARRKNKIGSAYRKMWSKVSADRCASLLVKCKSHDTCVFPFLPAGPCHADASTSGSTALGRQKVPLEKCPFRLVLGGS